VQQVEALVSSSVVSGLAPEEAAARLRHYGPNAITERKRRHAGLIFLVEVEVIDDRKVAAGVDGLAALLRFR